MNYGTLKTICLQKLFAIEGQTAEENDNTRSYLSALPAAVNEAMRQVDEMSGEEMGKLTGGLNIPGLM